MTWFERFDLGNGITRIREPHVHPFFAANMHHVRGRDADLIIDFGMGLASLSAYLELDRQKPLIAVATHAHVDHVGSFHEFGHRLGHECEAETFRTMADEGTLAPLFTALPDPVSREPSPSFALTGYRIEPAPLSATIGENDVIELGDRRLRVLHLPGHSPGSIGLLDERDGIFFSGDAIYDGGLVDDLPGCDKAAYRVTMERLCGLDISIAHAGHNDPMDRRRMRAIARAYLAADTTE